MRFRQLDACRAQREWDRYEGTAQRQHFQELRVRFLERHRSPEGWAVDVGSGPGRFLPYLGGRTSRRVALDLSVEMLRHAVRDVRVTFDPVRGDGERPPLARASFTQVAVLGNAIGFAGPRAEDLLRQSRELVAPGGRLTIEVVAGPGEHSRYLARLPPRALARLLRAPVRALLPRIQREGFEPEPARRADGGDFRRFEPGELSRCLEVLGVHVAEVLAVAPLLGARPAQLEPVAEDSVAWAHLLELEEQIGREAARLRSAAAVLVSGSV